MSTERVTMIWPKELKAAAREKAGDRNLTEFTIEAVEIHLGIAQDLRTTDKELNEVRYFAQQLADQLVLGIESPEERLQAMMELEFPEWIDTSGWPKTMADRVRPTEVVEMEVVVEEVVAEVPEEALEPEEDVVQFAHGKEPVEDYEEPFVPKSTGARDDLFAKVMAKTGGALDGVPGLKLASDIPKPEPKPEPVLERPSIDDIEVDF